MKWRAPPCRSPPRFGPPTCHRRADSDRRRDPREPRVPVSTFPEYRQSRPPESEQSNLLESVFSFPLYCHPRRCPAYFPVVFRRGEQLAHLREITRIARDRPRLLRRCLESARPDKVTRPPGGDMHPASRWAVMFTRRDKSPSCLLHAIQSVAASAAVPPVPPQDVMPGSVPPSSVCGSEQ